MSHCDKVAHCDVTDLDALAEATEALGGVCLSDTAARWWGHSVGDYPLPEGYTADSLQAAMKRPARTLRFPGASYDVAAVPRLDGKKGYELVLDWYGTGGLTLVLGQKGGRLAAAYNEAVTVKAAKKQGFTVTRSVEKGKVMLALSRVRSN